MSDEIQEWLLKLIRERESSVIENLLRGLSGPKPPLWLPPVAKVHSVRLPAPPPAQPKRALPSFNPDRYLVSVLARYHIDKTRRAGAIRAALSLIPMIKEWAGAYHRGVVFSGSMGKRTAILGATDLDLFISLAHNCPETLRDIYDALLDLARFYSLSPQPRGVSIRIHHHGFNIDLVPGRRQPGSSTDHYLYRRKTQTRIQTNVVKHISYVKESHRVGEIRATKIWRTIHGLEFPSFALELAVIDALTGLRTGPIATNFYRVLYYLVYRFPNARLVDPANMANVVSDDLTHAEKQAISDQARSSLAVSDLRRIVW